MGIIDRPEDHLGTLRELCDHIPSVAVYQIVRSPEGVVRFHYLSSGVERILGISRPDAIADPAAFFSLIPKEDRERIEKAEVEALRSGTTMDVLFRQRTMAGSLRQLRLHAMPNRLPDGSVQVDGLFVDVAERHEHALCNSETRFRAFMDHSPALAWMKDADGRYVYASRAWEDRIGRHLPDWLGKTDLELWPAEIARQFQANDSLALAEDRTIQTLELGQDPDGAPTSWWVFKFPFQDAAGRRYVGGIGIDVTERERVKAELRQKNEELQAALDKVQRLEQSLVTMCAWTRRIQMDGRWVPVEEFLQTKFGVRVSHGISEEALRKMQAESDIDLSDVGAEQVKHETDREQKPGDANPPAEPLA